MPGNLLDYSALLKERLKRHVDFAKNFITHHGEQGRAAENSVRSVLKELLPTSYKLGSGFIVDSTKEISSQLDIVIYDDSLNSPISLDGEIGVFPVECVYGFIEVKTTLRKSDIDQFSKSVGKIRKMKWNKRYVRYEKETVKASKTRTSGKISKPVAEASILAPRSYLFAYDSKIAKRETLDANLCDASIVHSSHIHGVCIVDKNVFAHQKTHSTMPKFIFEEGDSFVNFHLRVLRGIQSIRMRPAFMDPYFE